MFTIIQKKPDTTKNFEFAIDIMIQTEPLPIARHVFITGEIGINYNAELGIAGQMIDMAEMAG